MFWSLICCISPTLRPPKKAMYVIRVFLRALLCQYPISVYYAVKGVVKPVFLVTGEKVKMKATRKIEIAGDMVMGGFW